MIIEQYPHLKTLPPEQKLALGELWDDIASVPEAIPPRKDHLEIIQKRCEKFQKDPKDTISWEDLKARILSQ